jgi:hypothetical protein
VKRRISTAVFVTTLLTASLSVPALAANERMELECTGGDLEGTTLERTNGSSWWEQSSGTVYTTRSILVTHQYDTVYEHTYGKKSGPAQTCVADHFGFTWHVEVVAAGSR